MQTTLRERVLERMLVMKLTNIELANACKVKPPTSFNWASGKTKNIKGAPLLLAAKALGVTPEWLANGIGPKLSDQGRPIQSSVQEPAVTYLPERQPDPLTTELLKLFSQLDAQSKMEYLMHLRGFVAGRRPHQDGNASGMAG